MGAPSVNAALAALNVGTPSRIKRGTGDALGSRHAPHPVFHADVGPDSKAQRLAVTTGIADGDWVAVEGPLLSSDVAVVRGGENLQDGATVKIIGTRSAWKPSASPVRSSR